MSQDRDMAQPVALLSDLGDVGHGGACWIELPFPQEEEESTKAGNQRASYIPKGFLLCG